MPRKFAFIAAIMIIFSAAVLAGCSEETAGNGENADATAGGVPATTVSGDDVVASAVADPVVIQTTADAPAVASGTTEPQSAGELIDGLRLADIRWGDNGSYLRVVFDLETTSGQEVDQAPFAQASMTDAQTGVEVTLGGIRGISEKPNALAQQIAVGDSLVASIERIPSMDDQALIYRINLEAPATYTLSSLDSPARVVVDIYR